MKGVILQTPTVHMIKFTGLIDGDLLAYKASSAVQKDIYWGDGLYTCHAYLDDAIDQFEEIMGGIKGILKTNHNVEMNDYSFVFSDPNDNFRKHLMPDYKNNRLDKRKPTCYYGLVDWIRNNYESKSSESLEADDVIGINSTPDTTLIVSLDKDFKTLPTHFYRVNEDQIYWLDEDKANYWHMFQTLVGDTADGYKGCPGIGAVRAERILKDVPQDKLWETVVNTYKKAGLTEDDALLQARMAYILRPGDTKDTLWTPDKIVSIKTTNS